MVAVALLIGLLFQRIGITNVALVFLTAVLVSAITYGLWPSLFACLVAMLAYNFFFSRLATRSPLRRRKTLLRFFSLRS